jgi:hypothetical protein
VFVAIWMLAEKLVAEIYLVGSMHYLVIIFKDIQCVATMVVVANVAVSYHLLMCHDVSMAGVRAVCCMVQGQCYSMRWCL